MPTSAERAERLNQYKIEEELTDEQPDIRFDDLTGTSEEEATLLISDDFVISEEDFLKKKAQEKQNTFVKIENDPRVTRVGRFIASTALTNCRSCSMFSRAT